MKEQTNKLNDMDEVSKDTVYSEMYIEMRRFRDYQIKASMWYTTILVSILGFIFTIKFAHIQNISFQLFRANLIIKILILTVATVIGVAACLTILYTNGRYYSLRKYTDKYLEPKLKESFVVKNKIPQPHKLMLTTILTLTVVIDLIIILPF